MTEDEARKLFEALKDAENAITAKSLVDNKELVNKQFPSLITDFEKINLAKNSRSHGRS